MHGAITEIVICNPLVDLASGYSAVFSTNVPYSLFNRSSIPAQQLVIHFPAQ